MSGVLISGSRCSTPQHFRAGDERNIVWSVGRRTGALVCHHAGLIEMHAPYGGPIGAGAHA